MEAYQQRVVDEEARVDSDLEKLHVFIEDSPIFKTMTPYSRRLMLDQRAFMTGYRDVLRARIADF